MKIDFHSPVRKVLIAAVFFACALAYLALTAREFVAAWLGNRPEISRMQMAARLDPGNAEYRNHVGRYYDLVTRDPGAAIGQYKAAVQLNPHSARYWFDLASAYQVLGDTTNQASALEHAIQADSMTPDVAWEAGNLYLVKGDNQKALHEFSVVLGNDTSLANPAIQYCWRIDPDVDSLLRDVIPVNADAYLAFLTMLETKQETAGAIKVWDALIKTHQPFEQKYGINFFQYLILHKDVESAIRVWKETADRFGLTTYLPSPNNLIVNGSFSFDTINAGLDWQHQKQSGVQLTLDPTDYHSGPRSLQINFDGPGIHDAGIYQFVPVQPNTTYEFSAYYKNGEMDGAGGPHFTIQDMYSQVIYYESDELKEAGYWKSVTGEFTTSADATLLVVHFRRVPEGSPIRGKLWVDDLRLIRKK